MAASIRIAPSPKGRVMTCWPRGIAVAAILGFGAISLMDVAAHAEPGVFDDRILFGQSAAFEGPAAALGLGMREGILASFNEANGLRTPIALPVAQWPRGCCAAATRFRPNP